MVQILGILGSPRRSGNTELLLDAVLEGAAEASAEVEKFALAEKKISPCIECGGCDETGICVQKDDMESLYAKIAAADVVVLASPIFFYNITAYTQAVVERSQACWVGKHVLKQGPFGAKRRKGVFLSLGATRGKRLFEGVQLVVRYFFDAIDADSCGALLYRGIEEKGAIRAHPTALTEARELGVRLAKEKNLTDLTYLHRF